MFFTLNFLLIISIVLTPIHSKPSFDNSYSKITSKTTAGKPKPLLRPTWIDIDLNAVISNVRELKRFIGDEVHLMAVVKANAYGYGMLEIARTALASGATWLGVATLDEALTLRHRLSKDFPILVLGYVPPVHVSLASRYRITVTGISLEWIEEVNRIIHEPVEFHLKLDTGMNRLGCKTINEVQEVLKIVSSNPNLNLSGVFTHFATSEDVNNRTYYLEQLERFQEFLRIIPNRTEKVIHCANSGATLYQSEKPFFNMVRCGKALTGPPNDPLKHLLPVRLQTAISVHSTLDLVKLVNAGESIGYGREYITTTSQWIGTVPIGYGDGLHQYFKATGVLVEGKRFPIVGRVSMDQLTIGLDQKYPIGTRVTFIGQQKNETITADEVARLAQLPRSEVLSGFLSRIPRIYQENALVINTEEAATEPLKSKLLLSYLSSRKWSSYISKYRKALL